MSLLTPESYWNPQKSIAHFFFPSETAVKTMWEQFRQDDPRSTFQFEKFLSSISDSIHSKEKEKVTMEEFIRIQNETHEEEVSSAEESYFQNSKYVSYRTFLLIDETPLRGNGAAD